MKAAHRERPMEGEEESVKKKRNENYRDRKSSAFPALRRPMPRAPSCVFGFFCIRQ